MNVIWFKQQLKLFSSARNNDILLFGSIDLGHCCILLSFAYNSNWNKLFTKIQHIVV